MKKKSILSLVLVGVLSLGLIGCGNSNEESDNVIKIGVSPVPHSEIVNSIVPDLEAKGYEVEVIEFTDYVQPNIALDNEELDANYFQHIAYLNSFNADNGTEISYTAEIHLEPMAAYSYVYESVEAIKEGATVAIPNDPSNEARALRVLEEVGLITLPEGELITPKDIIDNPKNLEFKELEAAQLPLVLEEVDIAVINGNYALDADLDATKDGIASEDGNADSMKERRNVLAVKKGTEDEQKIKDLTEALTSAKVKEFIETEYKGAVVPVFEVK